MGSRDRLVSLTVIATTLAGCSLDLDRLRARDVGLDTDAHDARAPDAQGEDARASDTRPARDTFAVLRVHDAGPIDAFTAGRDSSGAWLVLGGTSTTVTDVARTDCEVVSIDDRTASVPGKALAAGDLDGDGDLDVIAASSDGFVPLTSDGDRPLTVGAVVPHGVSSVTAVELANLDGDDSLEVIVFGSQLTASFTRAMDGGYVAGSTIPSAPSDATILAGAVMNVSGDEEPDVVRLLSRTLPPGSALEVLPGTGTGTFGTPTYDGFGRTRHLHVFRGGVAIASGSTNEVFVIDAVGSERWDVPSTGTTVREAAFAQIRDEGREELVVLDTDGALRVFELGSRDELTERDRVELGGTVASGQALAVLDLDLDGADEVFVHVDDAVVVLGLRPASCP
jgi:hypothetical protein